MGLASSLNALGDYWNRRKQLRDFKMDHQEKHKQLKEKEREQKKKEEKVYEERSERNRLPIHPAWVVVIGAAMESSSTCGPFGGGEATKIDDCRLTIRGKTEVSPSEELDGFKDDPVGSSSQIVAFDLLDLRPMPERVGGSA